VAVDNREKKGEAHEGSGNLRFAAELDVRQWPFSSALRKLLFTVSGRCLWSASLPDLFLLVVQRSRKVRVRHTTRSMAVNGREKKGEARARSGNLRFASQLDVRQWPFSSAL